MTFILVYLIIYIQVIWFNRSESENAHLSLCSELNKGGFLLLVDLTWSGWVRGRRTATRLGLPYIRVEASNHVFVQAVDQFLKKSNVLNWGMTVDCTCYNMQ